MRVLIVYDLKFSVVLKHLKNWIGIDIAILQGFNKHQVVLMKITSSKLSTDDSKTKFISRLPSVSQLFLDVL